MIPSEIKRLYDLGLAIHWLKPKSKMPVESGWTKGERHDWETLQRTYHPAYNFGVRLGSASVVAGGFLAVLDVDVKSNEAKHRKEALNTLFELFPQVYGGPHLISGRGNGSTHYYVRLSKPKSARGDLLARAKDYVKVHMPSVAASAKDKKHLSEKDINKGFRVRPAWEISLLSEGRQCVLVGSTHPDTGATYTWGKAIKSGKDIPILEGENDIKEELRAQGDMSHLRGPKRAGAFNFVDVGLGELPLSRDQIAAIRDGRGVTDRSAEVFKLCIKLVAAGIDDKKIISLFTDQSLYLGQCAFDHAHSSDRQRAARWLEKYCLRKAKQKVKSEELLETIEVYDTPSDAKLVQQKERKKIARPKAEPRPKQWPKGFSGETGGWEETLELKHMPHGLPPKIKATYPNIQIILENLCAGEAYLKFNEFAGSVFWNLDTPWGNKKNDQRSAGQQDSLKIKDFLNKKYDLDAPTSIIDEVLNTEAEKNKFHPVKIYLEDLVWDGKERIPSAFRAYLGSTMPDPYLSSVSEKFFLACIKRIYQPGCKFDHVVVLEGKQGTGKSTFANVLASDDWFLDGLPQNLADKDAALNLQGAWICELSELASLYRSSNESTKAFITRRTDKLRPPYGQRRVEVHRQTVFLGTTNEDFYFTDATGNRRFWPVSVVQCDFKALERDRDQLWAEALFKYRFEMQPLFLEGVALHQSETVQELRRIDDEEDAIKHLLSSWLEKRLAENDESEFCVKDLFNGPLISLSMNKGNSMRAGSILKKFGFEKRHTKKGNFWRRKNKIRQAYDFIN